jgi:hypothetical protein
MTEHRRSLFVFGIYFEDECWFFKVILAFIGSCNTILLQTKEYKNKIAQNFVTQSIMLKVQSPILIHFSLRRDSDEGAGRRIY